MEQSQTWRPGHAPAARRSGAFHVRKFGSALFVRLTIWLCFGGLAAIVALAVGLRNPKAAWVVAMLCGILWLLEWTWGRHAPLRKPLLTVDAGGIGSPAFPRKRRHLRWKEIASVTFDDGREGLVLVVEPTAPPGKTRRAFRVRLALLSKTDRQLVQALVAHHAKATGIADLPEMVLARTFAAQMQALPRTWGVYGLIAANVAVWLAMVWRGAPIDNTAPAMLIVWGGNLAVLVQDGQWWRLLTAMFLHGGLKHLAANMAVLYVLGRHVERFFGTRGFLLIYFGAGLLGSAASLHFAAQHAVAVGASGAVFGIGGALLAAVVRHRRHFPAGIHKQLASDAALMVGFSLVQGFVSTHIDNAAHVGGLIGGVLLALCLPVRLDPDAYRQTLRRGMAMAAAVGVAAVLGTALLAPTAPQAMRDTLAANRQFERAGDLFMKAVRATMADGQAVKDGKMTSLEADRRSRAIHAPAFEQALSELLRVTLPPGDKRAPLLQDMTLLADLMHEYARMESVLDTAAGKYIPVDPVRAKQMDADIARLMQRMQQRADAGRKR